MTTSNPSRIKSLDLLKGLVMILMALDHTRDYFHFDSFFFDPVDPEKSNYFLFLTRWITHYCAPAFSLLAGIAIALVGFRKDNASLASFLLKRGIWLILVEIILVDFGWYFDITFSNITLGVIWVLGLSMLCMSALIYLPKKAILAFALVLIAFHNALDGIHMDNAIWWSVLHEFQLYPNFHGTVLAVVYPLIPWVGVMALGYVIGDLYHRDREAEKRQKLLLYSGIAATALFFVVRGLNGFGNAFPLNSEIEGAEAAFISFLGVNKYPPSLAYLLMTLGPSLIFLSIAEKFKGKWVDVISVYGKVPFFYYVVHIYLIHLIAMIYAQLTGFGWQSMILKTWVSFQPSLQGYGVSLPMVYLITAAIVILLYPICKSYGAYKHSNKHKWWMSYL